MSLLYNIGCVVVFFFRKQTSFFITLQLFHVALKKYQPLLGNMSAKTEAALTAVSLLTLYAQEPGIVTGTLESLSLADRSSAGGKVGIQIYKNQAYFLFSGGREGITRIVSSMLYSKVCY